MAKSKSQQATNLAKQYTADQLAAAMIYGETRAGVDAKGKMTDQLAGVRELRAADNRSKATGKDISGILAQPKQFQGLNQQSLKAITNPDSLKNPGDRAAANAALAKAKDYFAGKYEGQVGKGTPYENVTSFNKASEAYNTQKSGAVPGSHVAGGDHNFFTTTDMAKRLQQTRTAEAVAAAKSAASQPGNAPTESINVATPTAVVTPQGTSVAAPKGEISSGQTIQGSNVIERGLGPLGQKDDGSNYEHQFPNAYPMPNIAGQSLYKVPPLDPYKGSTLGAGNVAGIPTYAYASPNKSIGTGTGAGNGTGAGTGTGGIGGAGGAGGTGSSGASGTGAGSGGGSGATDGTDTGAGAGAGASNNLPSGFGDGTISGGGYGSSNSDGSNAPMPQTPSSSGALRYQGNNGEQDQIPQGYGVDDQPFGGLPDIFNDISGPTAPEIVGQDYGDTSNIPSNLNSQSEQANPYAPYVDWNENGQVDPNTPPTEGGQAPAPAAEEQGPPMPPPQEQIPFSLDQLPQDTDFGISPVPGPDNDVVGQLPDLSGVQYASLDNGIMNDASGNGGYEIAPNPSSENIYNYTNPYVPDNLDTGSGGIDLGNSGVTYISDPSSYLTQGDYNTGGADLNASIGMAGNIDTGWNSGGGGDFGLGGGGGDMMMLVATGGRINSHVKEALKRTRKFAKGGSVAKEAHMILSKKAASLR